METSEQEEHYPSGWHRTFYTMWLGSFITGAGYSMTMPFISLFINELGNFSRFQLNIYSGLAFAATFVSQAIVSPLWGNLADRKGRKLMCMRAAGVMAITIFCVGLAQNVWMIIGLRFLQGAFSGYINNATALMAGETPRSHSGWVMSAMATAGVAGNLVGPLLGGVLSGAFGYRIPFFITGGLMFLNFVSTSLLAKEHFKPIKKEKMKPLRQIFQELDNPGVIIAMFFTTMVVISSSMSITPIISLYVKSLMHNQGNVALVAGIVAATPGLGTLIAASKVGHTMDRIGPKVVLRTGLMVAFVLFIPMTFTHSAWSLAFWRFLLGLANAALNPAIQTVLTLDVPAEAFGRIFSVNQSFQAVGAVMGSLIGSVISGLFNYPIVFAVTGLTLLINMVVILVVLRTRQPQV